MTPDEFERLSGALDDIRQELKQLRGLIEAANSSPTPRSQSNYLTIKQAALEYNFSAKTLYRMQPPIRAKLGKSVRIRRDALERKLAAYDRLASK